MDSFFNDSASVKRRRIAPPAPTGFTGDLTPTEAGTASGRAKRDATNAAPGYNARLKRNETQQEADMRVSRQRKRAADAGIRR